MTAHHLWLIVYLHNVYAYNVYAYNVYGHIYIMQIDYDHWHLYISYWMIVCCPSLLQVMAAMAPESQGEAANLIEQYAARFPSDPAG